MGSRCARRDAERARVRGRYLALLTDRVGLVETTAELVVAAIFDHVEYDGRTCCCGCHPQLSRLHDDGMDCPCGWDDGRRAGERVRRAHWWENPAFDELRAHHEAEEAAIAECVAGQIGVEASRTTSYAPEQWEGTVGGHTFYFRERHGEWQLELDIEPSGRYANRLVDVGDDGVPRTEPVEMEEGDVIARGLDTDLGATPTDHLAFVVRAVRDESVASPVRSRGNVVLLPVVRQPDDRADVIRQPVRTSGSSETVVSVRLIEGAPVALVDHPRAEGPGLDQDVTTLVFGPARQRETRRGRPGSSVRAAWSRRADRCR